MPKYINAEALKAAVNAYCDKTKPCSTISVAGLIRDVLDILDATAAAAGGGMTHGFGSVVR